MPNRAAQIRADVQARYPGATVGRRGGTFLDFALPNGQRHQVITSGGGLHYDAGGGVMAETDTSLSDTAEPGYTDAADAMPWRFRAMADGTRRVWPRRNILLEYIDYQNIQRRPLNLSQPYAPVTWTSRVRADHIITWSRANAQMRIALGETGFTLELVLLNSTANGRILFPISLTGLTRQGASLVADSDGATVATVQPLVMTDVNGVERAVPYTFVAAGVYIEPDASGMTYPVRIV